ncbi:MAG: hypothetical protein LBD67_05590, partial [Candidatus Accumulibacter sp.]|nr:hypothetical protein [Accumulibacter sp.]
MNTPQKSRFSVKAAKSAKGASFADVFSRPPFRAGACSAALLLCLGASSVPALAQQTINITTDTSNHVCGNGTAGGGLGSGNCGVDGSGNPNSFDAAATTGNTVSITGTASVDNPSYGGANYNVYTVHGAFNSGSGGRAVERNQVTINTTGTIQGDVTGGNAYSDDANALAKDNRVIFQAGTAGEVHGGNAYSDSGISRTESNRVEMSNGVVDVEIYGGHSDSSTAAATSLSIDNHLEITGSAVIGGAGYGGVATSYNGAASADENTLTLSGSARVGYAAFGGYAVGNNGTASADENTLTLSGNAQVGENAFGAYANSIHAAARGNHLTLSGSAAIGGDAVGAFISSYVYGGDATATQNTITISGGNVAGGSWLVDGVAGGAVEALGNVTATDNHAIISGGAVGTSLSPASVYGGQAVSWSPGTTPTATLNTVTVSGSAQVYGDAIGGRANARASGGPGDRNDAVATFNTLTISGGNVEGAGSMNGVAGGQALSASGDATATDNRAFISSSAVIGVVGVSSANVYGGYADGGDKATARDNEIEMSGGNVNGVLYGGYSRGGQGLAQARANTVTLSGGTASEVHGGNAKSNLDAAEARGNEVEISGTATVSGGAVYGAHVEAQSATAVGNTVTLSGGTVENGSGPGVIGAYAHAQDFQYDAVARANTVIISGGLVDNNLMGAYTTGAGAALSQKNTVTVSNGVITGMVAGGAALASSGVATAGGAVDEGNTVIVTGGEVQGDIYGGFADSSGADAFATHNIVTLSGTPNLTTAGLYGGFVLGGSGNSDAFTGNTLNLKTSNL